jgi:hypothetical protein
MYLIMSSNDVMHFGFTQRRLSQNGGLNYYYYIFIYLWGWVQLGPLLLWSFIGLFYQLWMIYYDNGTIRRMNEWQRKPKYLEKTCRSAALSTKDPTWFEPGSNPVRRGRKPATNRLIWGTGPQNGSCRLNSQWACAEASTIATNRPLCPHGNETEPRIKEAHIMRGAWFVFTSFPRWRYIWKNGVFWDVTPCGSCKNRRFGGT